MITGGIIFVLGLIFGSFLNALEYRIGTEKSLSGRSICPKCKKQIKWYDNIPVLSYISLLGKCRSCKKHISLQYPVVELITGSAFLVALYKSPPGIVVNQWFNGIFNLKFEVYNEVLIFNFQFPVTEFLAFIILNTIFFILILVALYDAKTKYVLTYYIYAAATLALIYNLLQFNGTWSLTNIYYFILPYILSAVIPALAFWGISKATKEKAMGSGDADIAIAIGLLLGWPLIAVSYYFAFIVGALWGISLLISKKAKLKSELPLGPFLISGVFFAFIFGEQIIGWYARLVLGM